MVGSRDLPELGSIAVDEHGGTVDVPASPLRGYPRFVERELDSGYCHCRVECRFCSAET